MNDPWYTFRFDGCFHRPVHCRSLFWLGGHHIFHDCASQITWVAAKDEGTAKKLVSMMFSMSVDDIPHAVRALPMVDYRPVATT